MIQPLPLYTLPRKGTPAASMPDGVDTEVKKREAQQADCASKRYQQGEEPAVYG